jgi:uncharacterized protein DUF4389
MRDGGTSVSGIPYYPPTTPPQLNEPTPVQLAVAGPAKQRRATVAFRSILAIPHLFVLYFLAIAAGVVAFIGWWGALFMGRLPDFAASYLTGYARWNARVQAYLMLLTDVYPPFALEDDPSYPVHIAVSQERLNRAAVFFRFILVIPAGFLNGIVTFGAGTIVSFIAWLITLIAGQLPASLHQAFTAVLRYQTRTYCYCYLLTPTYPGGLFGDSAAGEAPTPVPPEPGYGTPGYGAPGYGTPGYGTPGYSAPGYETPGYGAPSGTPGYGTPGYGAPAPGYGGPAYGAPGAGYPAGYGASQPPAFQPASWQMVLAAPAKRLLVLFIVLGALVWGAYGVLYVAVIASGVGTVNNVETANNAFNSMNSSYNTLSSKLSQWQKATAACNQKLTCVTGADSTAASDFSTFGSHLQATAMPSGAAAAADQLYSDATKATQDFTQLSQSTTVEQYQSTVASTNPQQTLTQFDQDFNSLMSKLSSIR